MTHGSLFSGIGGFDLAADWMGWENIFHCEWNKFGQTILKYYWPKADSYEDITKTDFTIYRGSIDILTGGFPCQPYSVAGKRKGKADERHLWPEMLRAVREIQPRYVVAENVGGLISWNGGLVFHEVQTDLEAEGYQVQAFILPACAKNAPHRRDRVWFIAYAGLQRQEKPEQQPMGSEQLCKSRITTNADSDGHQCRGFRKNRSAETKSESEGDKRKRIWRNYRRISKQGPIANAGGSQLQERTQDDIAKNREENRAGMDNRVELQGNIRDASNADSGRQSIKEHGEKKSGRIAEKSVSTNWTNFPTQSLICDGNDGLSTRLDTITFPKWRNESIKGGGNAIVPQIAFEIFKAINQLNKYNV